MAELASGGPITVAGDMLLTMDLHSTKDEVVAREAFFKRALGTRVFGLNAN